MNEVDAKTKTAYLKDPVVVPRLRKRQIKAFDIFATKKDKKTRLYKCNICAMFITRNTLEQHLYIHTDIKRYVCRICKKVLKHQVNCAVTK